jgi:molybdate transport system ATP-binding protein
MGDAALAVLDAVQLRGLEDRPGFDFALCRGERVGVVGGRGSGKSLLLEVLAGRHLVARGRRSYPAWSEAFPDAKLGIPPRRAVQLVSSRLQREVVAEHSSFHQARWHASFSEPQTVEQLLEPASAFGLRAYEVAPAGLVPDDYEGQRSSLMEALGLAPLLSRKVAVLSNGELRKLLLVRALLARPQVLLLDDPLGGLDPDARREVASFLLARSQRGELAGLVVAAARLDELESLVTRTHALAPLASARARTREVHDRAELPAPLPTVDAEPPASPSERLLRLNGASVCVGSSRLLTHVSFEVRDGEHWMITGPNGAGKSTLLALILGDHPQSYAVDLEVLGLRPGPGTTRAQRRRHVAHVAPELYLHYPGAWTALEVVVSGFSESIGCHVAPSARELSEARYWLGRFGLHQFAARPLQWLSESEQRRTLLARALVRRPRLLFLDEPLQGLGAEDRHDLLALLDEQCAARGVTVILVTHHAAERPACITHHLELAGGRVVSSGTLARQ